MQQLIICVKINWSRGIEKDCLGLSHQKYPESFEMWYWRRMEKTSWAVGERNGEVQGC